MDLTCYCRIIILPLTGSDGVGELGNHTEGGKAGPAAGSGDSAQRRGQAQ